MTDMLREIALFARGGTPPEPADLSEDAWARWAGGRYAWEVLNHRGSRLIGLGEDRVPAGSRAAILVERWGLYRRKVTCLTLRDRAGELGYLARADRYDLGNRLLPGADPNPRSSAYQILRREVLEAEITHRLWVTVGRGVSGGGREFTTPSEGAGSILSGFHPPKVS